MLREPFLALPAAFAPLMRNLVAHSLKTWEAAELEPDGALLDAIVKTFQDLQGGEGD